MLIWQWFLIHSKWIRTVGIVCDALLMPRTCNVTENCIRNGEIRLMIVVGVRNAHASSRSNTKQTICDFIWRQHKQWRCIYIASTCISLYIMFTEGLVMNKRPYKMQCRLYITCRFESRKNIICAKRIVAWFDRCSCWVIQRVVQSISGISYHTNPSNQSCLYTNVYYGHCIDE